ncbi:hypothetical protein D9619_000403 [Psilocybe cf. subviscida]|uniref:AIG1-type G domain-containing protein n=1 Tax=Psilocybe cf. subviscida TaxID=2480587 RepID=A0A8H5BEJ6_9AGAR|nr:hypothetical protein D9619_000403 [Psilocybe cf. subviscida]
MATIGSPSGMILVLGVTGVGKSTFICSAARNGTGKLPERNPNMNSSTASVEAYKVSDGATTVLLVDTPGFNDTKKLDQEVLKEIITFLRERNGGYPVLGVIYLLDITDQQYKAVNVGNLHPTLSVELVTVTSRIDTAANLEEKKKELKKQYPSLTQTNHFGSDSKDQYETAWKIIREVVKCGKRTQVQTAIHSLENTLQVRARKSLLASFFKKLFRFKSQSFLSPLNELQD